MSGFTFSLAGDTYLKENSAGYFLVSEAPLRILRLNQSFFLFLEQLDEGERATGSSLRQMSWDTGNAIGPYISGLVQMQYGFAPLFVSTTMLYALSLICVHRFFGGQRQPAQALQS